MTSVGVEHGTDASNEACDLAVTVRILIGTLVGGDIMVAVCASVQAGPGAIRVKSAWEAQWHLGVSKGKRRRLHVGVGAQAPSHAVSSSA